VADRGAAAATVVAIVATPGETAGPAAVRGTAAPTIVAAIRILQLKRGQIKAGGRGIPSASIKATSVSDTAVASQRRSMTAAVT